tara:strand:- start:32 stop:301 length:270 start_codon:yes stop_codon:yes gene_type:complete
MARSQVRLGDVNSGGAPVIGVKAARILTNGSPSATAGDIVAPHDAKPTHFAVTTSSNPRVLMQGVPVTRIGDFDTCFHVRITGSGNVLT